MSEDSKVMALIIPWLLIVLLLLGLLLLVFKKKRTALLVGVLVFMLNWSFECVPFRLWRMDETDEQPILRVMSFNVDCSKYNVDQKAQDIVNLIVSHSPDVVFIAEFCEYDVAALDTLLAVHFPYTTQHGQKYFHYFYSKYPLGEEKRLKDETDDREIGAFYASVHVGDKVVDLYGCHLPSNNYTPDDKAVHPDSIKDRDDVITYLRDIKYASRQRQQEASIIAEGISGTKRPVLLMGDMNDVSGSPALRTIADAGMKDAWWHGGCGYGATIMKPLPYRIDHILYSSGVKLLKIKLVESQNFSDHHALYTEFAF